MGIFGKLFNRNSGQKNDNGNIDSLSIIALSKALYPILPRSDYIEETSPLFSIFKMRCEQSTDPIDFSREFLVEVEQFLKNHTEFDFPYYWLGSHYLVSGQHKKAEAVIYKGINSAEDRSLLATLMGNLRLQQSNPIAIGWAMQACLLASIEFAPYKLCSVVAKSAGNESLYWRLRNAGDVISTAYSPTDEREMQKLVEKSSMVEIQQALLNFEDGMDNYLPLDNDIPKEKPDRDVFLSIEREYIQNACNKLFRQV